MPEDVEELALALVDLVLVPLSIPAGTGHGSRVLRAGLLPLVSLPLRPCFIRLCESETHYLEAHRSGPAQT
jgi:hypothetical protein